MKCIIIEDEVMARKSLEHLCAKVDTFEMVGVFEDANQAVETVDKGDIDLMFLDIELPGMSGIEFLEQLPYLPQVVFTTSNTDYAFEAYQYDVTDFLKKPITLQRFLKAVEKIELREKELKAIAYASATHEIYIKSDGRFIRLPFENILYFENTGDYVKVVTNKETHVIHGSLKSIDHRIKNPRFLKIHRSYIVNMDKIKDIEDNTLVVGSKVIPISRAHKPILMRSINLL
ncbi:LytR/AlgR family response regulator transcription factor [Neolewinella agarilytica]|uniref:Two component transcriptional regulator, LytTR family n=1 Tax=Neolewinella agarilytica TaxID=478744 RepID=A0A1H9ART7_9BACT|nr:LytTR family DNA-binding domain-containing protein [Neolewinella agarilytica]SEP79241.1 two component transcriptional regulator, LytTR family [Neolewinella agarilytica]